MDLALNIFANNFFRYAVYYMERFQTTAWFPLLLMKTVT